MTRYPTACVRNVRECSPGMLMEANCKDCGALGLLNAQRICSDCAELMSKKAHRISYLAHRPARLAYQREYYQSNKPAALDYARGYLQCHKPQVNANARTRYARNHGIDLINPTTENS